ncbi:uncharacterized protein G2W53_037354 [Senna tora]|uniref:Uncharacterized protein n=1 Tax=Senna tora TaxID=362788 RepID=A0A834SVM5_9FABA|nr:uncharacterized protein G2W53_037354 [Senna tora]
MIESLLVFYSINISVVSGNCLEDQKLLLLQLKNKLIFTLQIPATDVVESKPALVFHKLLWLVGWLFVVAAMGRILVIPSALKMQNLDTERILWTPTLRVEL